MDRFDKSNLAEIELEMQGIRVAIKKGGQVATIMGTAVGGPSASDIANNA